MIYNVKLLLRTIDPLLQIKQDGNLAGALSEKNATIHEIIAGSTIGSEVERIWDPSTMSDLTAVVKGNPINLYTTFARPSPETGFLYDGKHASISDIHLGLAYSRPVSIKRTDIEKFLEVMHEKDKNGLPLWLTYSTPKEVASAFPDEDGTQNVAASMGCLVVTLYRAL